MKTKYISIKIRKEDIDDLISGLRSEWAKAFDIQNRCYKTKSGRVAKKDYCAECGGIREIIFDEEFSKWILNQKHYVESLSYLLNRLNLAKRTIQ